MLTHRGGKQYEFLMQLLIIKDLVVVVVVVIVVVGSYETLPNGKIRLEIV